MFFLEEDKLYDTRTHVCCGESLYPRYDNGSILDCCAGKVYKVKESLCCNEVFYPNRSSGDWDSSYKESLMLTVILNRV